MQQHTLKESFSLSSKGLHTGLNLTVSFCPAEVNHGYKIQRTDLEGQPIIEVLAELVVDTSRGTVIGNEHMRISTIEHAMAALVAMGVDNCLIRVDGPEFPILDGSSKAYVEAIQQIGLQAQAAERQELVITQILEYTDEATGSYLRIEPYDEFAIETTIYFDDSQFIKEQTARLNTLSDFASNFAQARTFVFVREVEALLKMGLIKGGDLTNALVIYEYEIEQERLDSLADALGVPHSNASRLGYLQERPIVWENEPARHKLLDVIGDMALVGKRLRGRIVAHKPGHKVNNQLARLIRQHYCQ